MFVELSLDSLPQINLIEQQAHTHPWSEKILASCFGRSYHVFGLVEDSKLQAYAFWQVIADEATLMNIAVDPELHRKGCGQQLLEKSFDELKQLNVVSLWLEVRASNNGAINLYFKNQFDQVDVRKNYYPTDGGLEDAIIMSRILD